jgi:hypothetical protein
MADSNKHKIVLIDEMIQRLTAALAKAAVSLAHSSAANKSLIASFVYNHGLISYR